MLSEESGSNVMSGLNEGRDPRCSKKSNMLDLQSLPRRLAVQPVWPVNAK